MNTIIVLHKKHICLCAVLMSLLIPGILSMAARPALAAAGYVHFKGQSNARYITNLKIQYALMPGPIEDIITVIPEQTKYEKYPLSQVRKIEFLELIGEKKQCPVYRVRLYLRRPGHWRDVLLMPLKELQGTSFGAPWIYPVDFNRDYEDNAEALQEIRIVPERF
ncbi:hypothetical protein MASR1M90_07250 [Desulfovibrionales bacterium]